MGYCIDQIDNDFFIPNSVVCNIPELNNWEFRYDEDGNINTIYLTGEKLDWGEKEELESIAQYVKPGSYVEINGEDGSRWRWIFEDGKVVEKEAKITY